MYFFEFIIFKQFLSENWMSKWDCCGPDGHLDTKIDQNDFVGHMSHMT